MPIVARLVANIRIVLDKVPAMAVIDKPVFVIVAKGKDCAFILFIHHSIAIIVQAVLGDTLDIGIFKVHEAIAIVVDTALAWASVTVFVSVYAVLELPGDVDDVAIEIWTQIPVVEIDTIVNDRDRDSARTNAEVPRASNIEAFEIFLVADVEQKISRRTRAGGKKLGNAYATALSPRMSGNVACTSIPGFNSMR